MGMTQSIKEIPFIISSFMTGLSVGGAMNELLVLRQSNGLYLVGLATIFLVITWFGYKRLNR